MSHDPSLLDVYRSVNDLLRRLALGLKREEMNREIIHLTESLFGERIASITTLDPVNKSLHIEAAPNMPAIMTEACNGTKIGPNVGSCGAAAFLKEPVIVSDIETHPNWLPFLEITREAGLAACWSVPVIASNGSVVGSFAVYSRQQQAPSEHEMEVLELLSSLYAVALEKYQLEEKIHYQANHDNLTGCLNRHALTEYLAQSHGFMDAGYNVVCLFADIDRFKDLNDRYGHHCGDEMLIETANILRSELSEDAIICRYGGDEFVALDIVPDQESARFVYQKLTKRLNKDLVFNGEIFSVSLGMGISRAGNKFNPRAMIAAADHHMYDVKRTHEEAYQQRQDSAAGES